MKEKVSVSVKKFVISDIWAFASVVDFIMGRASGQKDPDPKCFKDKMCVSCVPVLKL